MDSNELTDDNELQARLQYLLDLDISGGIPPEQRLLLGILRQSVIDYFGDDPLERLSASLYFARSPVYQLTLQLFNLPVTLLPIGIDLSAFERKEQMSQAIEPDPLRLETLVRRLSGTQLKVVLTMGLLPLPAATRKISLNCALTRATVLSALEQLAAQGLVERHDQKENKLAATKWSLPEPVRKVLDDVWGDVTR